MDYTITLNQGCTLSMYVDQYTYTGSAHGGTYRHRTHSRSGPAGASGCGTCSRTARTTAGEVLRQVLKQADARYKGD